MKLQKSTYSNCSLAPHSIAIGITCVANIRSGAIHTRTNWHLIGWRRRWSVLHVLYQLHSCGPTLRFDLLLVQEQCLPTLSVACAAGRMPPGPTWPSCIASTCRGVGPCAHPARAMPITASTTARFALNIKAPLSRPFLKADFPLP